MAVTAVNKLNAIFNSTKSPSTEAQEKVNQFYSKNALNPFTTKNGEVRNKYLDYQRMLDNSKVSNSVKNYISEATGLTPRQTVTPAQELQNTQTATVTPLQSSVSSAQNTQSVRNTSANVTANATTNTTVKTDSDIVKAAQKYIGTPYVWGGESMEEGGMDCSGFVYNALKDAGYKVGRTTAQGYRSYGNTVSKSEMQPGDLVFYGSGGKATHIGIYIGDGQIIQSSGGKSNTKSNPGKGVSIKNVDYRNDFLEARRY